jgi:hypothetical protein
MSPAPTATKGYPLEMAERLERLLTEAVVHRVEVYRGVINGFSMTGSLSCEEIAAERQWPDTSSP